MAEPLTPPGAEEAKAAGHRPEHLLERLIFFNDAVFAIAITLLVIELHIPELPDGTSDLGFIQALLNLTPNLIGFFVSFFVIGAFWSGHHRAFGCAIRWDDRVLGANILLLFAIAAMPFVTAFLSNYSNYRVPVVLYCCWLLLTALLSRRLQMMVLAPPIVDPGASPAIILRIRRRSTATIFGALSALIAAMVVSWPVLALVMLLSIPLWRRLLPFILDRKRATAGN